MLIEFEVENYLSFRDRISFSLEKTPIRKHPNHVLSEKIPVLSGATIYGNNASGKSNLFFSMMVAVEMVEHAGDIASLRFPQNKYRSMPSDPTYFSFVFQGKNGIYKYSFKAGVDTILEEQLCLLDKMKNVKQVIFNRKAGDSTIYCEELAVMDWYKYRTTSGSSLLLSKLRMDGILERSEKYVLYFKETFDFFDSFIFSHQQMKMPNLGVDFQMDDFKNYQLNLLQAADLGITDVKYLRPHKDVMDLVLKKIPRQLLRQMFFKVKDGNFYYISKENGEFVFEEAVLLHGDQQFDIQQESKGTLKLLELSSAFYLIRKAKKSILFIDELCSSLHPKLVEFLLRETLKDLQTTKSQVIITSHDLYMLSEKFWRKDQIWFTEKEVSGNSILTCLSSIDTRHDKSVYRNYLKGLYGAIPILPSEVL